MLDHEKLFNVSGLSNQIRLDILDVAESIRPGARVIVRPGKELQVAVELVLSFGLAISVGKGMARIPSKAGSFADHFAPESAAYEKMAILYLAETKPYADSLQSADENSDDSKFGSLLGYPACCVEFVRTRGGVPSLSEAISLYSKLSSFDPLIWPASALLDATLVPHFPCSGSCVHTISIAQKRWALIKRSSSPLASHIQSANSKIYWVGSDDKPFASERLPGKTSFKYYSAPKYLLDMN